MSRRRIMVRNPETGEMRAEWTDNETWGHIPQHGHGGALVVGSSNSDAESSKRYRAKKREQAA